MSDHPQSIVRVTWLVKYRKVLAETGNEGQAIFEADRSVRRAHGSSARIELYNRQILVDHFKGKRNADDSRVQREFELLRQQAEIDWREMYAGKNSQATPDNIAEDYINNAKLTADTQRVLKRFKLIAVFAAVVVGNLHHYPQIVIDVLPRPRPAYEGHPCYASRTKQTRKGGNFFGRYRSRPMVV